MHAGIRSAAGRQFGRSSARPRLGRPGLCPQWPAVVSARTAPGAITALATAPGQRGKVGPGRAVPVGGGAAGRGARRGAGTEGPGAQELSCIIAPPQFLSMRAPNVSMFAGQKCSPTSELFLPAPRHGAVRCDK